MEAEYDSLNVEFTIACNQFAQVGGTDHFSWSELNDGWKDGNEPVHSPWGYIVQDLPGMLENLRAIAVADTFLNISSLPLSSGYRCPVGNTNVGSPAKTSSRHMAGDAVDISTRQLWGTLSESEWRARYDKLKDHAESVGFYLEDLTFDSYSDHHLHLTTNPGTL